MLASEPTSPGHLFCSQRSNKFLCSSNDISLKRVGERSNENYSDYDWQIKAKSDSIPNFLLKTPAANANNLYDSTGFMSLK